MVNLKYDPILLDSKWQSRWASDQIYTVSNTSDKPNWYELTMYPYPSGNLHIGHWYAMAPADAHARFRRMQGYNVLHPMGFDAFGLPAENAAIKNNIHPFNWTMKNIENMREQLRSMGSMYDWEREVICCLPDYYKWNQWFFLKLFNAGLAYRSDAPANWCASCVTTLANEQVVDGKCERCSTPVIKKDLEQWFFKITKYADELLDFSEIEEWPEKIKTIQTNWIGRSEGVEITFDISQYNLPQNDISTFTTRIDTIYGVTFMALAPENSLVKLITQKDRQEEVDAYIQQARRQTEVERTSSEREKTGVFTGAYCINKLNNQPVPIYVADYVLSGYGTGAVMGVPAHDQRDFEFASSHNIPIVTVISSNPDDISDLKEAYTGTGVLVNSGNFNNVSADEAKASIANLIESNEWGSRTVSYRIRDWLISRQRYWGTPIPIVYCDKCGTTPVNESDLPVLLPDDAEFKPSGESPLNTHSEFRETHCPKCSGKALRETDPMDTFVDSSWYQFRYTSPTQSSSPWEDLALAQWAPVDQYTGGAEHAVMHLLYARFFTKALRDLGLLSFGEPFKRLYNQGHIIAQNAKMSKSRGNVITPDDYVQTYGADVVRIYLMFLGPWDQGGQWSDNGINGIARWINRVWDLVHYQSNKLSSSKHDTQSIKDTQRLLHKTIKKALNDLESFKFNTMLATLMEFTNALQQSWNKQDLDEQTWTNCIETLVLLLAPIAPHITEELWEYLGKQFSIHQQSLPIWDEELARDEEITLVVQVNGKVRDKITVSANITESEAIVLTQNNPKINRHIDDKQILKTIYVPQKLVNIVTK